MIQVERVDYIRVPVKDIEEAKHFYGELLGLPLNPNSPHDDWVEFEAGNVTLAVMTPHTHEYEFTLGQVTLDVFDPASAGQEFAPSPAGIAIRVPNVAAARAELEAKGVQFDGEIVDTGVCHFAFFKDPDGNALMLHRRYAPRVTR